MNVELPGINLEFFLPPVGIQLQPLGTTLYTTALTSFETTYHCMFLGADTVLDHKLVVVLAGESYEGAEIPYRWQILRKGELSGIHITFFEDPQFIESFCFINFQEHTIQTTLVPKDSCATITIDPLFHPLGSILMVVLAHHHNDILLHASGIRDKGTGRLFTAVSGTGKSTMAGLWKDAGADVINDDRLWLRKVDGKWYMFNTPMPYYAQKPLMAPLNEIFLIRQSAENEIAKLTGAKAAMRFMANGIQHFYDKEMTGRHLDRVLDIASNVPIYDCGFKPTGDIVEEIKALVR
jgi:hypothetical protein